MAQTFTKPNMSASANGYSSTVTSINATARPRLVAPLVESLDFMSVPLLKMIKKGKAIDNPKYEWSDERFAPITATADGAGYNSAVTTVNVASGHGARIQVYAVLRNQSSGELLWVSAVSTDALTVSRGFGGSTAASIAANQVFDIVGSAVPEIVDTPASTMTRGELYYNHIQKIERGISVDDIQAHTNNSYLIKGNELSYEKMKQMKEGFRDLERILIMGGRTAATSGPLPYSMGGLYFFTSTNSRANSGAALTETQLLTDMQTVWSDVGPENMGDVLLTGIFLKQVISSWVDPMRRATAQDTKFKAKLTQWENDMGTFTFLPHYHNPAADLLLFDPGQFKQLPYEGLDWSEEDLARVGKYQRSSLSAVYTLEAKGDRTRLKITGSSTTRADYPTLPTL